MTKEEIIEMAKQCGAMKHYFRDELLTFARLIEQATREADIAIARDFVQYHMDFDKADECAVEIRSQK